MKQLSKNIFIKIPDETKKVLKTLTNKGFESYIVGGCVRDLLRKKQPTDWDVTTNATPKDIQKIFPQNFYANKFGTVTVQINKKTPASKDPDSDRNVGEVEITTFRTEEKYTDKRHPDKIKWAKTVQEDLSRRDFTVNAMAIKLATNNEQSRRKVGTPTNTSEQTTLIDPFKGQADLKNKIIRTVGDPKQRFSEDALRLLRAVRFATTLDSWKIEEKTLSTIKKNAHLIQAISKERIRQEIEKIIMSKSAYEGILLLHKTNLLEYIIPELEKGYGVAQNKHHIYTIFKHSLLSLKYASEQNYNLNVRLAALLHDIAKPQTKRGKGEDATFYNHDIVGAKIAIEILERLRFSNKTIEKVGTLVRNHMFYYDPEIVTESSVRKLLRKVGKENIKELIQLRTCDRKGSGVPKARPYRLRHLEYILSKVSRHPISVQMLKIDGNQLMQVLKIKSSPKIGLLLNALLAEVLESPEKNKKQYLQKRAQELNKLTENDLRKLEKKVKEKKMEVDQKLKNKFWVK
jgi:poly(A) polymerase/tRNA nucleotidyltransferase (CCA-adding enzyme)